MDLPARAYIVASLPYPAVRVDPAASTAMITRSIHLKESAAESDARHIRQNVFDVLVRAGGGESEDFVQRLLAYRTSVKVIECGLAKIDAVIVE